MLVGYVLRGERRLREWVSGARVYHVLHGPHVHVLDRRHLRRRDRGLGVHQTERGRHPSAGRRRGGAEVGHRNGGGLRSGRLHDHAPGGHNRRDEECSGPHHDDGHRHDERVGRGSPGAHGHRDEIRGGGLGRDRRGASEYLQEATVSTWLQRSVVAGRRLEVEAS